MDGPIEWIAAIGTIIAAALVAADIGRRWTGWGFVLFMAVSITWIISGTMNSAISLVIQNTALLAINGWGVWRYLLNPDRSQLSAEKGKTAPLRRHSLKNNTTN